jgi:hypothetical protein
MNVNHYANFNNYCKQHNLIVTEVPADGHCLLYAVVHSKNGNLDQYHELLNMVTEELLNHVNEYHEYTFNTTIDDLSQASQQYTYNKQWNHQLVDIIPIIISKVIKYKIIIYKIMNQNRFIEQHVTFDDTYQNTIQLVLYNNHYNSIRNSSTNNQTIQTTTPTKRTIINNKTQSKKAKTTQQKKSNENLICKYCNKKGHQMYTNQACDKYDDYKNKKKIQNYESCITNENNFTNNNANQPINNNSLNENIQTELNIIGMHKNQIV